MAAPELHYIPPLGPTADPPIASVPPDVLGYILNFVYQKSDGDKNKRPNSPIVFSHVCRFWRSIALDNSLWWTRIIVTPLWNLDEVGTFLDRSKECPLDLRIFVNVDPTTAEHVIHPTFLDNYQHFRNLVSPHIHRCRIFYLQAYFNKTTQFLVPYLLESFRRLDMPYLEQFIVNGRLELEEISPQQSLFSSAPFLRELRIGGHGLSNYLLPLSGVTKLHLTMRRPSTGIPPVRLNAVFNECISLTELALYDNVLDLAGFSLRPLFVFPSLITLHLLEDMALVSEFLILISSAPKLHKLVLVPVSEVDLQLLARSTTRPHFPSLTSLVLSPMNKRSWAATAHASTCFPDITRLTLHNVYHDAYSGYFLEITAPLFPCLLHLALKGFNEALSSVINDFVIFRRSQKVPLKSVFVDEALIQYLLRYSQLWGDTKVLGVDQIGDDDPC
ncbi:hypothetical protein M413DRAFT_443296 [Hebeloma cylindrosporum]|uniref:F-box domain-containing protein n=1 Tax=Hebeloma cylindrosporum TaxID=76867 RepID=A0A0C3CKG1_HEBCY|nr:hypothetical protein M413DRAFT_443296 [Hebeloma cylindrosporum h7]